MARWSVSVPVAGEVWLEVEADDEVGAIGLGLELAGAVLRGEELPEGIQGETQSLEAYERLIEGNVFHGATSRATAEEVG